MKKLLLRTLVVCLCLLAVTFAVNAQKVTVKTNKKSHNPAVVILKGTGKAAVTVVGTAAKMTWGATKFVAGHVAAPLLFNVAPRIGIFMLKSTGAVAKRALPLAVKLSLL